MSEQVENVRPTRRFGCPNGHNAAYTVYGPSWHRCALCGENHRLTDVPEESIDVRFPGVYINQRAKQEEASQ